MDRNIDVEKLLKFIWDLESAIKAKKVNIKESLKLEIE